MPIDLSLQLYNLIEYQVNQRRNKYKKKKSFYFHENKIKCFGKSLKSSHLKKLLLN